MFELSGDEIIELFLSGDLKINSEKHTSSDAVHIIGKIADYNVYGKGFFCTNPQTANCSWTNAVKFEKNIYQHIVPLLLSMGPNFIVPIAFGKLSLGDVRDDPEAQIVYDQLRNEIKNILRKFRCWNDIIADGNMEEYIGCISMFFTIIEPVKTIDITDFFQGFQRHRTGYGRIAMKTRIKRIMEVCAQIFLSFVIMNILQVSHNDLHFGNILILEHRRMQTLKYNIPVKQQGRKKKMNSLTLKIRTRYEVRLFDWDRATLTSLDPQISKSMENEVENPTYKWDNGMKEEFQAQHISSKHNPFGDFLRFICIFITTYVKHYPVELQNKIEELCRNIFGPNYIDIMNSFYIELEEEDRNGNLLTRREDCHTTQGVRRKAFHTANKEAITRENMTSLLNGVSIISKPSSENHFSSGLFLRIILTLPEFQKIITRK